MAMFCVFPTKIKNKKNNLIFILNIVYMIHLTDDFNACIIHISTYIHPYFLNILLGAVKREDVKAYLCMYGRTVRLRRTWMCRGASCVHMWQSDAQGKERPKQ